MPIKLMQKYIPGHLRLLLTIYLIELLVFLFYRFFFYYYNQPDSLVTGLAETFTIGLQFDLAVVSYAIAPLFILMSIEFALNKKKLRIGTILFYALLVIAFLTQLLSAGSIPYYKQFGNPINQNVFLYAKEAKFVSAMIFGDIDYWGFLLVFALIYILSSYLLFKAYNRYRSQELKNYSSFTKTGYVLLSCLFLFVGLRGRLSFKSPLHEGMALISNNNFINSLAVNPNFPFWKNLLSKKEAYQTPENINELFSISKNYLNSSDSGKSIQRSIQNPGVPNQYNVVVLLMESLCLFKMGYYNGVKTYPLLDSIVKESVFFDRFFSSGIHTFNGLFSTLTGFPSILNEQPLRNYTQQNFEGLAYQLKKQNYYCSFYTTHDKHFDNMAGFLKVNSFDQIIDNTEITSGEAINNLGVPDHVLYDEFLQRTKKQKPQQPFLAVLLSASDHGPWDVPKNISFQAKSDKKEENAAAYADWALFRFLEEAKKEAWYKNTIFVILGDHGLSMGHTYQMPLSYHHIPLVIHCPALLKPDTVSYPAYQPDVGPTLLSLLNISYPNKGFGQNAFEHPREFVLFTADDKIGAVTKDDLYYFELLNSGDRYLYHFPELDQNNLIHTKQNYSDSLKQNVKAVFETAKYLIRQNHYAY